MQYQHKSLKTLEKILSKIINKKYEKFFLKENSRRLVEVKSIEVEKKTIMKDACYWKGVETLEKITELGGTAVIESMGDITSDLIDWIFSFSYGDVMSRPGLDLRSRQFATIGALTVMDTVPTRCSVSGASMYQRSGPERQSVQNELARRRRVCHNPSLSQKPFTPAPLSASLISHLPFTAPVSAADSASNPCAV